MVYEFKNPAEMGIYVNTGRKTLAAVKAELGADAVCNFQLFNSDWTACCFTKAGGKVLADDGYVYEGFGWNAGGALCWDTSDHAARYENFAGCLTVVKDGAYPGYPVPAALAGARGRTAIGLKADGTIVMFCVPDAQGLTIPALAAKLIALGCRYAVNFDGGGSAQCATPAGEVKSARVVHTLFWLRHAASDAPPALKRGDRGRAVKSLQTLLASWGQSCGWYGADGDFGPDTANAVLRFQRVKGLKPTGEADAKTWKTLIGGSGV